jgi:tetratricopeptide (TPR) repeat protein
METKTKKRLEWINLGLAITALILTGWNFWRDSQRELRAEEISARKLREEIRGLLGAQGASRWIDSARATPSTLAQLELARSKIDDELLVLRPKDREGLWLRAVYLAKSNKLDEALLLLKPLCDESGAWRACNTLGTVLNQKREFGAARRAFMRSLAANRNSALPHLGLCFLYEAEGELAKAERSCREAIRLDDTYAPAYTNLAMVLHEVGRHSEEIQLYEKALHWHPAYLDARNGLVEALTELGRVAEAKEVSDATTKLP